jgi:antitoxin component YwqK of YwqJK toxin-antitoxin module
VLSHILMAAALLFLQELKQDTLLFSWLPKDVIIPLSEFLMTRVYYPDNHVHTICFYKNGKKEGEDLSYWPNGKQDYIAIFKDGVRQHHTGYNTSGILLYTCPYVNGKRQGEYITYNTNGTIRAKCTFNNGIAEGEDLLYYDDGTVVQRSFNKNNKREGPSIIYYDEGKISRNGTYLGGLRQGIFIDYDKYGNVTHTTHYEDDIVHGEYTHYDNNGNVTYKAVYKNGVVLEIVKESGGRYEPQ